MTCTDDYTEPPEPDLDALEYAEHSRDEHDGGHCDCPVPSQAELEAQWAENARQHRADHHGGGECDCVAPF